MPFLTRGLLTGFRPEERGSLYSSVQMKSEQQQVTLGQWEVFMFPRSLWRCGVSDNKPGDTRGLGPRCSAPPRVFTEHVRVLESVPVVAVGRGGWSFGGLTFG